MTDTRPATLEADIAELLTTAARSYGAGRMTAAMLYAVAKSTIGVLAMVSAHSSDEGAIDMAKRLAPNVQPIPASTAGGKS